MNNNLTAAAAVYAAPDIYGKPARCKCCGERINLIPVLDGLYRQGGARENSTGAYICTECGKLNMRTFRKAFNAAANGERCGKLNRFGLEHIVVFHTNKRTHKAKIELLQHAAGNKPRWHEYAGGFVTPVYGGLQFTKRFETLSMLQRDDNVRITSVYVHTRRAGEKFDENPSLKFKGWNPAHIAAVMDEWQRAF